jgi:hypothetical protein
MITHIKGFDTIEGSIEEIRNASRKKKEDPDKAKETKTIEITQMVVRSTILGFANPFSKPQAYQINNKYISRMGNKLYMPKWLAIDKYFGKYYDVATLNTHHRIILRDDVLRTDIEEMASIYFAKSQEQSTFDPEHAHSMAMREKELEIELAKKKGQQESI